MRRLSRGLRAALAFALAAAPAAALAQGGPPPGRGPVGLQIQGGAVHQFDSGLDGGGEVAATRWFVEPGVSYAFSPRSSVGISLGYGETIYDFSGGGAFGGGDPWGTARDLRVSLPIRFGVTESVSALVIPSIRWNAEDGADLDDGRTEGVIAAAIWRVSETFAIGPGLVLSWQATEALVLGVGGRYETLDFRLDGSGPAPDGVAEDKGFPVFLTATWAPTPFASLAAVAGVELGGELTLRDSRGRELDSAGYDAAPFLGLTGRLRF
jgi:hypothetical protein